MFAIKPSSLLFTQRNQTYGAIGPADPDATTSITHRGNRTKVSTPATARKFLSGVWDRISGAAIQRPSNMAVSPSTSHTADTSGPNRLASACFSKIIQELPKGMQSKIQPEAKSVYCRNFNKIYTALMQGLPELPYQFAAGLANNFALWAIERSLPAPSQGAENQGRRSQLAPWMVQNMLTVVCENLGFNEEVEKAYEERIFGEKANATTEGPVMTALRGVLTEADIGRYQELKDAYAAR